MITVTPVYDDGPGSPEHIKAYLKQAGKSGPTFFEKPLHFVLTKTFLLFK